MLLLLGVTRGGGCWRGARLYCCIILNTLEVLNKYYILNVYFIIVIVIHTRECLVSFASNPGDFWFICVLCLPLDVELKLF